jgi:hypothetical protein
VDSLKYNLEKEMTNTTMVKIDKSVKFTAVSGSSLIESYARAAGDLALRLKNGTTYIYKNVDNKTFKGFLDADSKGHYFGTSIRNKFVAELAE